MPVHHGGKVGEAAKKLALKGTSKKKKKEASKIMNKHKKEKH